MTHAAQLLIGLVSVVSATIGERGPATAASVTDEPLLVIVERGPGVTANSEQVRRAIAAELGRQAVGPLDGAAKTASRMLVVTLTPDSVTMQMRAAGEAAPRRRIEPLPGGEANLRVVAWLAGNLARDQAGELTDARPSAPEAPVSPAGPAATPSPPAPTPRPVNSEPAVVATAPAQPARPDDEAPWRLELSLGRALSTGSYQWYLSLPPMSFERIEFLAPARPGYWSWAAGIELLNGGGQGDHAYIVSGGLARRFQLVPGWLVGDAGVGGGLYFDRYGSAIPGPNGSVYPTEETSGPDLIGHLTGSLSITRWHLCEITIGARVSDVPDGRFQSWKEPFFAASIGLRIALQ